MANAGHKKAGTPRAEHGDGRGHDRTRAPLGGLTERLTLMTSTKSNGVDAWPPILGREFWRQKQSGICDIILRLFRRCRLSKRLPKGSRWLESLQGTLSHQKSIRCELMLACSPMREGQPAPGVAVIGLQFDGSLEIPPAPEDRASQDQVLAFAPQGFRVARVFRDRPGVDPGILPSLTFPDWEYASASACGDGALFGSNCLRARAPNAAIFPSASRAVASLRIQAGSRGSRPDTLSSSGSASENSLFEHPARPGHPSPPLPHVARAQMIA